MMTSHTSRETRTAGYRQLQTDSDEAEDDIVPHTQQSERMRQSDAPEVLLPSSEVPDSDRLVKNLYAYFRRGGLLCMVVEDVLQLLQFAFIITFGFYLIECVDYRTLFRNSAWLPGNETWWNELPEELREWYERFVNASDGVPRRPVSLGDIMTPVGQCIARSSAFMTLLLLVAMAVLAFRSIVFLQRLSNYLQTRRFYCNALDYSDSAQLANSTWDDVQRRLIAYCRGRGAPLLGNEVDELHVHQRLLRHLNYMVALVTSETLPMRLHVPLLGNVVYLPDALKWNVEYALFNGPFSLFRNGQTLPDAFVERALFGKKRSELAASLNRQFVLLGMLNLALLPLVALFQLFNFAFTYTAELRQNPTALSSRRWNNFAKLRYRHYNETDEQFDKRLACAHQCAADYLAGFRSRLVVVIARASMFIAGAFLAVLILLSLLDSDVLLMDNVLFTMTLLTVAIGAFRSFLPDPTKYFNPEYLFFKYASYIDYVYVNASDSSTFGRLVREAHTRQRVAEALQYRFVALVHELASPLVTPLVLIFCYAPSADSIVAFLHSHTVRIRQLGDVCSDAHFDMQSHRHPLWTTSLTKHRHHPAHAHANDGQSVALHAVENENEKVAEKLYLSFVHFHERNPSWTPAQVEQSRFLADKARDEAVARDDQAETETDAFPSLVSHLPLRKRDPPPLYNPLFLTSICDSLMPDESRPLESARPGPAHADPGRPVSVSRSIMFVRDRYECNRRSLADRNAVSTCDQGVAPDSRERETYHSVSSNLNSVYHAAEADADADAAAPPSSIRVANWTSPPAARLRHDSDSDSDLRYDSPPVVLTVAPDPLCDLLPSLQLNESDLSQPVQSAMTSENARDQ